MDDDDDRNTLTSDLHTVDEEEHDDNDESDDRRRRRSGTLSRSVGFETPDYDLVPYEPHAESTERSYMESEDEHLCEPPLEEVTKSIEDNPLFDKFQETLRDHLLKIKAQLEGEILDLDHQIGETDVEREEIGAKLYDLQRDIDKQRTQLHRYSSEILEMSKTRQKREENITMLRRDFNQQFANLKESKRIHNERIRELSNIQVLESELSKWSKEVKDEVTVAKRITCKDDREQAAQAQERRKMDLFLFNLDATVRRLENELTNLNEQIVDQDAIINDLNRSLADGNSDLEILQGEHKRLYQAWGEVIVAIQQRDKVLTKTRADLNHEYETHKILQNSIENTKKAAAKGKETYEKLSRFKNRIVGDLMRLENDYVRDSEENDKILTGIDNFNLLLERTDDDLKHARTEGLVIQNHLNRLLLQMDRQGKQRYTLEEKILELLQDQITSDKASDYRAKLLREVQERRRNLEITMSDTENQLANILLDLEKWKNTVQKTKENIDQLQKEHDEVDLVSKNIQNEISDFKNQIVRKMRSLDMLNKELDRLIKVAGGQEINPLEMKALELEKDIDDLDGQIRDSQKFWLSLQSNVVNLSQKRTHQLNDVIIARKQLLVIEQRALKFESDLARIQGENRDTTRLLNSMNCKFSQLNAKLYEQKKDHEKEEHQCEMAHQEVNIRLEDAELEILQLEEEIESIKNEIEQTKYLVMEKHHESLSWETKYKMAVETKKYCDAEMANNSEIALMKAEIHRMEVRLSQLKRGQERLKQDLDLSVNQRGHIFDTANARDKVSHHTRSKSRSVLQHKMNEIKNKIKQLQAEIVGTENVMVDVMGQLRKMEGENENKRQELEDEQLQDKLLQDEIEQGLLLKQEVS